MITIDRLYEIFKEEELDYLSSNDLSMPTSSKNTFCNKDDINVFMMLHGLNPKSHMDIIGGADHDIIYLNVPHNYESKECKSEFDFICEHEDVDETWVRDLCRFGVFIQDDGFCMYV